MKWVSDVLEICSGVRYQYSITCVIFVVTLMLEVLSSATPTVLEVKMN